MCKGNCNVLKPRGVLSKGRTMNNKRVGMAWKENTARHRGNSILDIVIHIYGSQVSETCLIRGKCYNVM